MAHCLCGCGRETPLAKATNPYATQGQPLRYYPGHRGDRREVALVWAHANRERLSVARRNWRARTRLEALIHYGGNPPSCACCGEAHLEFLNFDHINGDGGAERRRFGRGMTGLRLASRLKQQGWPEGIRILCWNCNAARGSFGYCPHDIPFDQNTALFERMAPLERPEKRCVECSQVAKPLTRGLCRNCYARDFRRRRRDARATS